MKRCSQCEFVYEDEQARCDMDGGELVYEPTLYPAAEAATEVPPPMKFRSRSFILTAAATVIMGLFLGIGFLGLSNRSESPNAPALATKPAPAPPAMVQPAQAATYSEATHSPNETTTSTAANLKSKNAAPPAASSATKPAPVASRSPIQRETKPAPTKAKREEDSKVNSLLKKTGRILKKPFSKW